MDGWMEECRSLRLRFKGEKNCTHHSRVQFAHPPFLPPRSRPLHCTQGGREGGREGLAQ